MNPPKKEEVMANSKSTQLSEMIRSQAEEIKKLCTGLDEATASRAPADRWSPKQVLSHLCGPEGIGFIASLKVILEQDNPRLDIEAENPYFSESRARMTLTELLSQFDQEYSRIADLVAGFSDEQLARKAHIPLLKETPLGEHPNLAMWVEAIGQYHLAFHIDHLREILQALGVGSAR
jgi:hypothetical protein